MSEKKFENLKELGEEELDNVIGGVDEWEEKRSKYLPKDHGRHIGQYEAEHFLGSKVYAVPDDNNACWVFGTLINSYEKDMGCDNTRRTHQILVESKQNYAMRPSDYWTDIKNGAVNICEGKSWTLFLEK